MFAVMASDHILLYIGNFRTVVSEDRYGSRPFATGGMLAAAGAFVLLELLPVNFSGPACTSRSPFPSRAA